jgi:hypothetical protein
MGILYGKLGVLTEKLTEDLKQPRTQAIIVAALSLLVAFGCFHSASRLGEGGKTG